MSQTETSVRRIVRIPADGIELEGALEIPPDVRGLVIFAHGSGSSRMSPRNRYVAIQLRQAGFATLLLDLLTEREDLDRDQRFNIALLAARLQAAVEWARTQPIVAPLPVGLFGASTGAAAALEVAAALGDRIAAVVSRGGRPDLAGARALEAVTAPTLLVVGGDDTGVIELNEGAWKQLHCVKSMRLVPGATHLFEEAGALERVATLATDWFAQHLRHRPRDLSHAQFSPGFTRA